MPRREEIRDQRSNLNRKDDAVSAHPDPTIVRAAEAARGNSHRTVEGAMLQGLARLGLTGLPEADEAVRYVRIPLPGGSLTIAGMTTGGTDLSMLHGPAEHDSWQASWTSSDQAECVPIYDSHGQRLPFEQDTDAALAAIAEWVMARRVDGGSRRGRG